jgi:hypothetical protein
MLQINEKESRDSAFTQRNETARAANPSFIHISTGRTRLLKKHKVLRCPALVVREERGFS